jgi:hypothetical protein
MLFPTRHRFLPRDNQHASSSKREAALRAEVSELRAHMETMEKEQQIQFQRIAEMQRDLDEIKRRLKPTPPSADTPATASRSCPTCGSDDVWVQRAGDRRQWVRCRACKHSFAIPGKNQA